MLKPIPESADTDVLADQFGDADAIRELHLAQAPDVLPILAAPLKQLLDFQTCDKSLTPDQWPFADRLQVAGVVVEISQIGPARLVKVLKDPYPP